MTDLRYPLHYPEGWERTRFRKKSSFDPNRTRTFAQARDILLHELKLLGAAKVILSTNIPLRQDGLPYARYNQPSDPGAAVYFELQHKPMALACDKWDKVIDNVWAIAKHIEAMRGQSRWGVGTVQQAFRGYEALLPAPKAEQWWEVLQVSIGAPLDEIERAYKQLAKSAHPDLTGGDDAPMVRLNKAVALARAERMVSSL